MPRRGQPQAVRAVAGAAGVDHAGADPARRRPRGVRDDRAPARSPGTGSTTPTASSARKSGLTDFKDWTGASFGTSTRPWGDEDSPALVTAVETALERALSVQLMHGASKPRFSHAQARRYAGPAGRARLRSVPGAGRGDPGGPGRRAASRVRARGHARRAGPPGGRRPHVDPGRRHPLPGRRGARQPVRHDALVELASGHRREDAAREAEARCASHLCGDRGSTPAPGREFVRYGGHTSCVAITPATARPVPELMLDAGTGIRRVTAAARRRPVRRHHRAHAPALGPRARACRSSRPATATTPGHAAAARAAGRLGGAEAALDRGMSPPHFPITPRQLRGDWTFGGTRAGHDPGSERFTVLAREIPHKGGRTFGYRVSDGTIGDRLHARPLPDRARARSRRARRVPRRGAGTGRRRGHADARLVLVRRGLRPSAYLRPRGGGVRGRAGRGGRRRRVLLLPPQAGPHRQRAGEACRRAARRARCRSRWPRTAR